MKITFSNLGSIKKTTLDLRPLTVIIGSNNTNKTYIAYAIHGLLQTLTNEAGRFIYDLNQEKKLKYQISLRIDEDFFRQYVIECREHITSFIEDLDVYFQDSSHRMFAKTDFKLDLSKGHVKEAFNRTLADGWLENKFTFERNILTIYLDRSVSLSDDDYRDKLIDAIAELIVGMRYYLFGDTFVLPAERNALIITYKKLVGNRYKDLVTKQRRALRASNLQLPLFNDLNEIRYPQPIEDFLEFLLDLGVNTKPTDFKRFHSMATRIENDLQQKNKTKFNPNNQEITINVKKGLNIDLHNASSSIKQLAPLILYLRYRAMTGDILIIDEPEMNLHPESQVRLLEILAILVNMGVNILLTTHSPYFLSHLNNLISGKIDDQEILDEQAKSLFLKDPRAFLNPRLVSAYEMRKNKTGHHNLHDLKDKDYGVRWDTLSDVSGDIQQKFFEIYEKGENLADGEEE